MSLHPLQAVPCRISLDKQEQRSGGVQHILPELPFWAEPIQLLLTPAICVSSATQVRNSCASISLPSLLLAAFYPPVQALCSLCSCLGLGSGLSLAQELGFPLIAGISPWRVCLGSQHSP